MLSDGIIIDWYISRGTYVTLVTKATVSNLDLVMFSEQLFLSVGAGSEETQNQIVTLANQIIAAMPERIKLSPSRGDEDMLVDAGMPQRERSSSHSSFSSYSSSATPPCADDSGISTPLEGLAYEEYRWVRLRVGTRTSRNPLLSI